MRLLTTCLIILQILFLSFNSQASHSVKLKKDTLDDEDSVAVFEDTLNSISQDEPDTDLGNIIPEEFDSGQSKFYTILRGLMGLVALLILCYIFSANRKGINWRVVLIGLVIQFLLAIGILKVSFIRIGFEIIGKVFVKILDFTKAGSEFLFSPLTDTEQFGMIFAVQILPTIIFFSALTSLLFYLGIIQKIVSGLAWLLSKSLQLSGAESLSVAGNIFLGQTESPSLLRSIFQV